MSFLRFFMLLALVVWIGSIVFFGAVVAPTLFSILPTHQQAGSVVTRSLAALHWMGIVSGVVFVACSITYSYLAQGAAQPFAARNLLIFLMIALTLVSQLAISQRMNTLRVEMGVIDDLPTNDVRRVEFNNLHHWSTRLEMTVLALGLVVLYLTARKLG